MHLANLESMNSPFTLLLERECRVYKCEWKSHVECMELEVSDISICYIKASIEVSPWCNFHNYFTTSVVIISGMRVDGGRVAKWSHLQLKQGLSVFLEAGQVSIAQCNPTKS